MARLNELTIRAALETAGVTSGVQEIIRELQRFEQAAAATLGSAALPDLSSEARAAAEEAGSAYSEGLVHAINSTRQNVSDAVVSSISAAAAESAESLRQAAGEAARAISDVNEAAGQSGTEREIRSWQDWADAVRASASAAEEAAVAQRDLAQAQSEVGVQTEFSAEQIARWDAEHRAREAARAEDTARRAAATATARASAEAAALRQQYEYDIASIKEAQLRQLLTPEEAAEAARISAEAYNRELLQAIQTGRGAGAFEGAEGQRVFTTMAGDLRNVQEETRRASVGMGRLNMTMASLARQATGTHPAIAQVASVVGSFAIGSAAMVAVLAGLAALAAGLRHFGREAREAKEELDEAWTSLNRIAEQRRIAELGPGGATREALGVTEADLERVRQALELSERLASMPITATRPEDRRAEAELRRNAEAQAEILREQYERMSDAVRRGGEQVGDEMAAANQRIITENQRNLAALVASGAATPEMTGDAQRLLNAYRQQLNNLFAGPDTDETRAAAVALQAVIDQLAGAFETAAAQRDRLFSEASRAVEDEVATLTEGAELRTLQAREMGRILELERTFARQLAAGNLSLEERNRLTRLLRETQIFQPDAPELASVDASVEIAGVTIANPEEMARLYREQVEERIERERIKGLLNLELIPGTQSEQREIEARAAEAARQATQHFNESIQASNEVLSAFGDLADTAGALDEGLAQALRGAQMFGEGLARYRLGESLRNEGKELIGALGMASGVVSAGVGIFNVFAGVLAARSQAEREAEARLRQTTDALERFRRGLSDWERTPEMSFGVARAGDLLEEEFRRFRNTISAFPDMNILDHQLSRIEPVLAGFGLTIEDVSRIAEDLGIDLYNARGNIDPAAWDAVRAAMRDATAAMTGFADNLRGIQRERSIRDSLLGIERDAEQNLAVLFGDISTLAPQLFDRYLAGIDPSDVEAVRAAIVRMFDDFALPDNVDFAALLGSLLPDDLIAWFEQVAPALEEFEDQIRDVTAELRGVPQGFRILNLELARYNATQARTAEDFARQIEEVGRDLDPARRDPAEQYDRGESRDRPVINDYRTFTIPVTQQPGEGGEEFAQRVVEIIREVEHEDAVTGRAGARYRPRYR